MTSISHRSKLFRHRMPTIGKRARWLAGSAAMVGFLVWVVDSQQQQALDIRALQAANRVLAASIASAAAQLPDDRPATVPAAFVRVQTSPQAADGDASARQWHSADANARNALAALAAFMARTASLEAAVAEVQGDLASLNESVIAVRDQLGDRLVRLERASVPPPPVQMASTEADVPVDDPVSPPAPSDPGPSAEEGSKAQVAALREAAMQAFQTLDGQFQAIIGRLDSLAERDRELDRAQEATMVALQTQLNDWRERHSPPVWDMAAQLSGVTVRFSEATRFADPGAADAILQQVSGLLLASDPSLGLRVVGYADFDGTDAVSNRITSQKRADAVRQQLVSLGVPEARLLAVGRSTEDRVIDSDAAGNANRRAIFEPFLLKDVR